MNFTDQDYKTSSKAIIEAPLEVDNANHAKADAAVSKADFKTKDDTNKLFFENVLGIITNYHAELKNMNGSVRTNYDAQLLDDAAQLKQGNVHLGGSWPNFVPKIHDSMSGLPISTLTDHEVFRLGELGSAITALKSGWNDGSLSGTTSGWSGGATLISSVAFPIGNRIAIYGSGHAGMAKVTNVTTVTTPGDPTHVPPIPSTTTITLTVTVIVAPSGDVGSGGTIQNFFGGFTNTERQNHSSSFNELLDGLELAVVTQKDALKAFITAQKTAVTANSAVGDEKVNNLASKAQAESALENIDDWEAFADTGVGAKYTDTGLQLLQTTISNRTTHTTARQTEIVDALGNISQADGGDYSGAGQYFGLAKWINLRTNMSNGTLRMFYDTDQIDRFFNEQIKLANSKKDEFEAFMKAYQLQAGSGGNVAVVENPAGLSVGDSVKVMDDDAPIMDATITAISGQSVTLSAPISGYSLDKVARLVKPL